jgi:hypothetical protein
MTMLTVLQRTQWGDGQRALALTRSLAGLKTGHYKAKRKAGGANGSTGTGVPCPYNVKPFRIRVV